MNQRFALAATLLALAGTAHAGRPLATEDADYLGRSQCEAEGFYGRQSASGTPDARGWTLQGACGIGGNTQVALAYSRARSAGVTGEGLLLGGKTGLITRSGDGLGLTLAWGLTGAKVGGGSFEHELTYLNLVATREIAPSWTGHANLGWVRSESADANSTTWNLAIEKSLGNGVDLMGEVYGDDRSDEWLGLGVRWAASDKLSLNASLATQNDSPRVRLWTVGFKYSF
ncbi:MAG: hypothetical protein AB7U92_11480 [Piscinibacter sp.]|uniref:hypothetical protein n=1 Tax=Piscinibacter sp. TaxID=1903157 RepID=UPI003D097F87